MLFVKERPKAGVLHTGCPRIHIAAYSQYTHHPDISGTLFQVLISRFVLFWFSSIAIEPKRAVCQLLDRYWKFLADDVAHIAKLIEFLQLYRQNSIDCARTI